MKIHLYFGVVIKSSNRSSITLILTHRYLFCPFLPPIQQKAKLHQECSLVIKDFEVSQTTIKELTAKLQTSERKCEEIAIKLKEMTNMFEKSDRDAKTR